MLFPIDHGNSAMKTVNFVFPSGLIDNPIRPPVDTEMLEYDGKFWTLSGQRISYMRDKTKDERYWILTLFAIAKELEKSGNTSPMVEADLAVGLPPEHYALRQRFADYFKRGRVNFVYNGAPICLLIRYVFVYPQAYAAVVPQAGRLKEIPRTFIIDIGGYTTDVMLLRNAAKETAARLFSLLAGRDHSAGQRTACVFIIVKASCKGGKHLFPFAASVYHNRCERAVKVPEGAQKSCKAKIKALLRPHSGQFQYKTRRLCVPLRVFRYC